MGTREASRISGESIYLERNLFLGPCSWPSSLGDLELRAERKIKWLSLWENLHKHRMFQYANSLDVTPQFAPVASVGKPASELKSTAVVACFFKTLVPPRWGVEMDAVGGSEEVALALGRGCGVEGQG